MVPDPTQTRNTSSACLGASLGWPASRCVCAGCDAVQVTKDRMIRAAGTMGYHSARVGLRAPRVAIRVEAGNDWQSMFGLAMAMASDLWGGYGFIYLPRGTDELHPALARILSMYDPDYLVDALWTHGDIEAIEPGWHARHYRSWPADPGESAARLASWADEVVLDGYNDDPGENLCSPYYERNRLRSTRVLSQEGQGALRGLTAILDDTQQVTFEVPEGLDPLLTLALGMRAGYPAKPPLPLGLRDVDGVADRLPQCFVDYVLSTRRSHAEFEFGAKLLTAWTLTTTGLVSVSRAWAPARPIAVIGSTAEDFALTVALDRMYGSATWVPVEWTQNRALGRSVERCYRNLRNVAHDDTGFPPIITSISLSEERLHEVVQTGWPEPVHWEVNDVALPQGGDMPEVVPAERLNLPAPRHLACEGDYDLPFTSATRADGRSGFEFVLPVPVYTPRSDQLRGPQRPFWEVDVQVIDADMPTGRNLAPKAILADADPYPSTMVRSGRDGISFHPMNMFFVPGGATLEQSIAKPRLRVLGLHSWIEALTAQDQPDTPVRLSQAGRRAMILTRLWGSRSAVARDLLDLNDFLRAFTPSGSSDAEAYPECDGVRLTPTEGYLTLAAARRTLPGMEADGIRERLNHLLHIKVLQRGLIVPCSECERRAFYRISLLGESNTCLRCGASAHVTAAWRSKHNEPEWFYDLHGAVRELLEQNGDIPFLAGSTLAKGVRSFEDIAELDFHRPDGDPVEIDIAALADGRLIIGEAKIKPHLGTRNEATKSIAKLLRVSDLVGAEEIALATTALGPWRKRDIDYLLKEIARRKWRFGKVPRVRVLTSLRDNPQNELLR